MVWKINKFGMGKMIEKTLSKGNRIFVFDEIPHYKTYVYLIEREKRIFVIDTFCGGRSMAVTSEYIENSGKEAVIINTHFHWDHIWGNCAFEGNTIISHEKCRELIIEKWEQQLANNGRYAAGRVEKILPNMTFSDRLFFPEEEIELFYTPGHTSDCISVFDRRERILYAGDNLEKPIVYVEDRDVGKYIETLKKYIELKPDKIMAGHTIDMTIGDIEEIIMYIERLKAGVDIRFDDEYCQRIHNENYELFHGRIELR